MVHLGLPIVPFSGSRKKVETYVYLKRIFCDFQEKWIIYKHVSDKSKKCLSVGR